MAPRYETLLKLASGGMATVWIGAARGALGFRQLVAIKKPHPHLLEDPAFRGELVAEARLASMIRHANVVDVRDVEIEGDSISLVMDFIEGASFGELLVEASKRPEKQLSPRVAIRIIRDACAGIHAAHELVDERDRPVELVHRDISPQNVLVGTDGIARVTDFGIAKFWRKDAESSKDSLKGKLAYMSPEYVRSEPIDRRTDVFAMGVVLWEALTGRRCFRGDNDADTLSRVLEKTPPLVSTIIPSLEPLDAVVACALAKNPKERFQNAAAMGAALEGAASAANLLGSQTEVAAAVKDLKGEAIEARRALVKNKLAHEPSVASLMGAVFDAPAPDTVTSETAIASDTAPNTTTLPVVAQAPSVNTLRMDPPPVAVAAFPEEPIDPPKQSLLPVMLGGLVVVGVIVGVIAVAMRKPEAPKPAIASSAPAIVSSSPPAAAASSTTVMIAGPVETTTPTATPTASSKKPIPKPGKSALPPAPAPAPTPAPTPAPSATVKKPPANPYE